MKPRKSLGNLLNSKYMNYATARTCVPMPNCFTYATARISEIVGYNQPLDDDKHKVPGAADLWNYHNKNFVKSSYASPGALMIWSGGYHNYGHVAVCEELIDTYTITWSQSNYKGAMFEYIKGNPNGYCGLVFLGYLVHKDLLKNEPEKTDYKKVAQDVIAGKYGNGQERKEKLKEKGYDPEKVQKEVNNILNNKKNEKTQKDYEKAAKDVIAGKYGNGKTRINKLKEKGFDPDRVQKEVNKILNAPKVDYKKVAQDVIAGKYGNGKERTKKLKAKGYDPKKVQAEVNKMLK